MKKKISRLLSLLLTTIMVVTILPFDAMAYEQVDSSAYISGSSESGSSENESSKVESTLENAADSGKAASSTEKTADAVEVESTLKNATDSDKAASSTEKTADSAEKTASTEKTADSAEAEAVVEAEADTPDATSSKETGSDTPDATSSRETESDMINPVSTPEAEAGLDYVGEAVASGDCSEADDNSVTWEITGEENNYTLTIKGSGPMKDYGRDSNTAPWKDYASSVTTVTVEAGVTTIGSGAFSQFTALTSASLPDGLTTLKNHSFVNTPKLAEISIPGTVTDLGEYAFFKKASDDVFKTVTFEEGDADLTIARSCFSSDYKSNLEKVSFKRTGKITIGNYAFKSCKALVNVSFVADGGKISVGNNAFEQCSGLESIDFKDRELTLGELSFVNADNLTGLSGISKLSSIGNRAFDSTDSLSTFTIPDSITTLGTYIFASSKISEIIFPNSLETIPDNMFDSCKSLTSIELPSGLKTIGQSAFLRSGLTSIDLEGITTIKGYAFSECTGLTSVTVPNSVTSMGNYVFYKDTGIKNASISFNDTLKTLPDHTFSGCTALETITFNNPDKCTSFGQYVFRDCEKLESISIPKNVKSIGDGAFYGTKMTTYQLPENLEAINYEVFRDCTNLKTIAIPDKVTQIKNNAFYNCTSLETVSFGTDSTLEKILESFGKCTSLTSFTIPKSVSELNQNCFKGCTSLETIIVEDGNETYFSKYNDKRAGGVYLKSNNSLYIRPEGNTGSIDVEEGTTVITDKYYKGDKTVTEVTIPSTVVTIDSNAFEGCTNLASVKFDGTSSLKTINGNAFKDCSSLTSFEFPASLETIEGYSFYNSGLKTLSIPANVKSLGNYSFQNCEALETVTFADGCQVTKLPYCCFNGCKALKNITLHSGITTIENYVFGDDKSLTAITIPQSVTSLSNQAFNGATALSAINVADGNTTYYSTDGVVYKKSDHSLYIWPSASAVIPASVTQLTDHFKSNTVITEITIPATVTSISSSAFSGCTSLQKVTFAEGSTLTVLPSYIFEGCKQLTDITLPGTLNAIEEYAFKSTGIKNINFLPENVSVINKGTFYECDSLKELSIPSSINSLEGYAFSYCDSLEKVTINNNITKIGDSCFYQCPALTTVTFEKTSKVETISSYSFSSCTSLKKITIPKSVTSLNKYAFSGCSALEAIDVEDGNPKYSSKNGIVYDFEGNIYIKPEGSKEVIVNATYTASDYAKEKDPSKVTIAAGVTKIDDKAFYNASKLKTVKFASKSQLTAIGDKAFYSCENLTSITLPKGLISIGDYAFQDCDSLKSIKIPDTVTDVGTYAFSYCDSLKSLTIPKSAGTGPTVGEYAFSGCGKLSSVTIQSGVIKNYAFYNCKSLKSLKLGGTLSAIGSYAFNLCTALKSVTIPNTVTSIGEGAFKSCSGITKVTVANGIESLPSQCFEGCTALKSVTFPVSLKTISERAFYGCTSLASVKLPEGLTTIGSMAFYNCSALTSLTLPESYTVIGNSAFYGMTGLKSITFSGKVTDIGTYAFNDCSKLSEITIPESVTTIGDWAFKGCASLTQITVPDGVTEINVSTFQNCAGLTNINLPATLTSVDLSAFSGCTSLETITVAEGGTTYSSLDGMLYKNGALIFCPPGWNESQTLTLSDSATDIVSGAFEGNDTILHLVIPASVSTVSTGAFKNCTRLRTVTFDVGEDGETGSQMTAIPDSMFEGCCDLNTVTFKGKTAITSIGEDAFSYCGDLTAISFDNNTADIALNDYTFYDDTALTGLYNGNGYAAISQIGAGSFYNCSSIKKIALGSTISTVPVSAFNTCRSLSSFTVNDANEDFYTEDGILYKKNYSATYTVSGNVSRTMDCTDVLYRYPIGKTGSSFTIPEKITGIAEYAFMGTKVKNVNMSDIISMIGSYAFATSRITSVTGTPKISLMGTGVFYDTNLKAFDFSKGSLEIIPDYTFQNCESLETVTLPDSVSEIKSYAFYECTSLSSMKLPEYITSIGAYAFYDCNSWRDAAVPETLTGVINEYSYYYCSYLTDITVSSNVTTIGNRSFKNCNNLKSIDFATREDGTTSLTSIGFDVFDNCRLLTEVDIPEGVQFISSFAFTQCSALKRATIPSTVTELGIGSRGSVNGSFLFEYCSNLKQLIIKNSALEIPQNIFRNSGSDKIYIYSEEKDTEGNDTKIKSWVDNYSETYREPEFVDISKLDDPVKDPAIGSGSGSALATSGQIPLCTTDEETGSIETTGSLMWEYNTSSKTLTISQNGVGETFGYSDPEWINFSSEIRNVNFTGGELAVTCLPKNAFYNCIMLEEISLPDGLTEIPYNAFYGCMSLKKVNIPSGVKSIDSYAFGNCLSLEKVEIPASTEVINYNVFRSCSKLKELSIPDDSKLVRIGEGAFVYCSSLTSVTIPASVEYIYDHAFAYCTALETVTFNEGLKYISEYAFYATVIKALELPASLATIEDPVFRGMSKLTTITVAADNDTYYSNEKGDKLFLKKDDSIIWWSPGEDPTKLFIPKEAGEDFDIAEIITPDMTTVEVEEGNTAFSVYDNAIYSYDGSRLIRVLYSATGEFSVRKGTSIISKNAFRQCTGLTSVKIPDSVYEIGDYAFLGCKTLSSIDLSANTAVIGTYTFTGCTSLESITLPYTLTSMGNGAFNGCSNLESISIPGQVEVLPDNCFANCSSLSDVRFSSGLKEIKYSAFYRCSSLAYLKLPEGLESIHDSAFKYCSNLERIDIPESVSFIYTTDWYVKDNTVYNCQSPFDYCSADLILYVVYGSYAYDHVMTQRYAYLDGDRDLSDLLSKHYELLSVSKYHITYALDHSLGEVNSTSNPDSYRMEDDAIEFEPASKEGYDFEGWYRDKLFKNRIDRLVPYFEGADITLYPRWIKLHTVTIKVDGQSDETMTVADEKKADIKDPVKEGSVFIGWVKEDGTGFCSEEPVTADMTITASFAAEGTDFLFAPVSDVWSGIIPSGTEVTLRTASEGASIQYTLDGSSPSGDTATVYSEPITITGEPGDTIQLKAVTVLSGKTLSSTVTAISFTIEDNRGEWGDVLVADRADFANADAVPEGLWVGNLTGDIYYTGKKIVPEVRIYYGKTLLEEKTDYKLSFKNNLKAYELSEGDSEFNPKKAPTLTVKGAGNYKDKTLVRNFIIKAAKMEMTAPVFHTYNEYNEWYYTGWDYEVAKNYPYSFDRVPYTGKKQLLSPVIMYNGKKLSKGKDYTITYDTEYYDAESSIYRATSLSMENASSNIYGSGKGTANYTDAGVYRMTITGTGNFTGTVPTQYEIVADAKTLKKVKVTGFVSKVPYSSDDDAMLQDELVLNDGETTLEEGNDYILKYSNSDAIGKATLEIFGTGQYIGHIKKTYQITGTALSKAKILGLEKSLPFTGKAVSQKNISLRLVNKGQSDTVLTSGKDYTVSYKNNIKAGTATVIFTGKGYYFGTVKKSFKITPIDIAADSKKKYPTVTVTTEESAAIQKGGAKPAVTVTYRSLILKEGVDYKLSYKNNTKPGTADSGAKAPSVTVNFKGNYKGTITKQFTAVN